MLKVAIIGVGNMGKNHARIFSQQQSARLVAIADTNESIGLSLAKKLKVKYYKDFQILLEKERPDAVSICVPTSLHFAIASYCIRKRIHILVEKPITDNVASGQKLIALAKKYNVCLFVGHIERFNPAVIKVKEMIDKGELGNVIAIISRRIGGFPPQIKDANIAIDLAIHDIDIINYLLNNKPFSISVNKQRHHIEQREDSVEIFMKYKKTSAYIQANWISPVKIRKLNITGTEGYLEMDYVTQKIEYYKSNYKKLKETTKDFSDYILRFSDPDRMVISVAKKEPLREEIMYFLESIESKTYESAKFAVDALKIAQSD